MSENIMVLLNRVMEDVGAVSKKERNQQQNFNFRGIDAVVNAVSPALRKHGVIVWPEVQGCEHSTVEVGQRRTPMGHCRVTVMYTFAAPDMSCVKTIVSAESMDSGDKATAKAMSVAFRTALLQTLCLPTDETDPDHDIYERAPRHEVAPPAPKAELTFEERYAKFEQLCESEGFNVDAILAMANIKEPSEENLPIIRETYKAYKAQVEASERQKEQRESEYNPAVAEVIQTVRSKFSNATVAEGNAGTGKPNSNRPASEPQVKKLLVMYKQAGIPNDDRLAHASQRLGLPITSFNDLTSRQASQLIDLLGGN